MFEISCEFLGFRSPLVDIPLRHVAPRHWVTGAQLSEITNWCLLQGSKWPFSTTMLSRSVVHFSPLDATSHPSWRETSPEISFHSDNAAKMLWKQRNLWRRNTSVFGFRFVLSVSKVFMDKPISKQVYQLKTISNIAVSLPLRTMFYVLQKICSGFSKGLNLCCSF
jgi:hypothetical protein